MGAEGNIGRLYHLQRILHRPGISCHCGFCRQGQGPESQYHHGISLCGRTSTPIALFPRGDWSLTILPSPLSPFCCSMMAQVGSLAALELCPREGPDQDNTTRASAVRYILQYPRARGLAKQLLPSKGASILCLHRLSEEARETRKLIILTSLPTVTVGREARSNS